MAPHDFKLVLNRNPENYFAEIEQAAFDPANFVPGIGPSPWWLQRILPAGRARSWKQDKFIYGDDCLAVLEKYARLRTSYTRQIAAVSIWLAKESCERFMFFLARFKFVASPHWASGYIS